MRGAPVWKTIAVPGSDDRIVLFRYTEGSDTEANLARVGADGTERWRAVPSCSNGDACVAARWERDTGRLSANSFSCYYVVLDPETGQALSRRFTK